MPKKAKATHDTIAMRHPDGGDFTLSVGAVRIQVQGGRAAVPLDLVPAAQIAGLVPDLTADDAEPDESDDPADDA